MTQSHLPGTGRGVVEAVLVAPRFVARKQTCFGAKAGFFVPAVHHPGFVVEQFFVELLEPFAKDSLDMIFCVV